MELVDHLAAVLYLQLNCSFIGTSTPRALEGTGVDVSSSGKGTIRLCG